MTALRATEKVPGMYPAYDQERDIAVVQELLGHASLDTTRRYVKVPSEALRRTVEAVGRL